MTSPALQARVFFNRPLAEPLTYGVPDGIELAPGMLVAAPLGTKTEIGCIAEVGVAGETSYEVRQLAGRVSPEYALNAEIRELAAFVADYYLCAPGEALAAASMLGFNDIQIREAPRFGLAPGWEARAAGLTKKQAEVLRRVHTDGTVGTLAHLAGEAGTTVPTLRRLLDAGALVPLAAIEAPSLRSEPAPELALREDQRVALEAIESAAGTFRAFLLFGVTGSGKTEVYLQAIRRTLDRGGTALCLVPEIALTPQTVARFRERFGEDIGVLHSHLTRREKLLVYRGLATGRLRIVIGARSAVFAPLPHLGLVVIDEEHEGSYKQGEAPRYHARDVALVRAKRLGIPVVLGSATPSLESFNNAIEGKYGLLRLSDRGESVAMPPVQVVDLAAAARERGEAALISRELEDAIHRRLAAGEQVLLFLNRRGFSNFLFCPSCKWVAKCTEDDVALTIHARRKAAGAAEEAELDLFPSADDGRRESWLACHFCGKRSDRPTACPKCGGESLSAVGSGTQRIEAELERLFPRARILRMDFDTVSGRDAYAQAYAKMLSGEADIILGTQMIAKGLHLENVTLVGAVLADVGLFVPDFRAEERTFGLLTQVAGRAGRTRAGHVILQTYLPEHTAVLHATRHDYEGFFAEEMRRRRQLDFPPVLRLATATLADEDRDRAFEAARMLAGALRRLRNVREFSGCKINGPTPAPISRLQGRYRARLLVRARQPRAIAALLRAALGDKEFRPKSSTRVTIDVDAMDLM